MTQTPGQLLREARRRHGVSQKRLAIRAGTTQSAISRIEGDRVSPSVQTLERLLQLLGEDLVIESKPRDFGIDRTLIRGRMQRSPEERVRESLEFSELIRRNHRAGAKAAG